MTVADRMLDTNILLYSVSAALADQPKRAIARQIVDRGGFGISGQVLAEFFHVATRKLAKPMEPERALAIIEGLVEHPCVAVDHSLVEAGAELSMRHRISYWDGAILAAAHRLGATVLYSEDLSHGQTYGSVRVENPFLNA